MNKNLNQEIQKLINMYKYGDFSGVLKKCSLLVRKHPKNDFLWNLYKQYALVLSTHFNNASNSII